MKRIFICAENVQQARTLADSHELHQSGLPYLSGPERLHGSVGTVVWLWGFYHRHPSGEVT